MPRIARYLVGIFALAIGTLSAVPAGHDSLNGLGANIHPTVATWALQAPGEDVPVVIQIEGSLTDAAELVRRGGGTIEHELTLINALSGTVPARMLPTLSSRPEVGMVTLDAPVHSTGEFRIERDRFLTTFQRSTKAKDILDKVTGAGIGVAVVDTGISEDADCEFARRDEICGARVVARHAVNDDVSDREDGFGHGTHVANTIGGYSYQTRGEYGGMAPAANFISVKVDDDQGNSSVGDVVDGLGWIYDNRDAHNIKVVNLSLSSSVAQSYKVDPLDAALELLWFNGITVVVAAGNTPDAYSYAPANDPFVITVGAIDERGTNDTNKHVLAPWSSRGVTVDGIAKPDVYAPGVNIVAGISPSSMIPTVFPAGVVRQDSNQARYRLSGTSMATAVVSGGAALLIEAHPDWTPGQVKRALVQTSKSLQLAPSAREIQIKPAFELKTVTDASTGIVPNYLLLDAAAACDTTVVALEECPVEFEKISWGSVDFNKISWSKISWSKISWSKISWGSVDYSKISWSKISWSYVPPAQ